VKGTLFIFQLRERTDAQESPDVRLVEIIVFHNVLGELIIAGKRGLIGETISTVSIFLPFP
jgi:hypothetical protein